MIFCIAGKNNIAVYILEFILFEKHIQKENVIFKLCTRKQRGCGQGFVEFLYG